MRRIIATPALYVLSGSLNLLNGAYAALRQKFRSIDSEYLTHHGMRMP
jgi:hypothetical protein